MNPASFVTYPGTLSGLQELIEGVGQYAWIYEWGMFVFLLIAGAETAWIFIDSSEKNKADKALVPRILGLVGAFLIIPAFIFRYTNIADGVRLGVLLQGEPAGTFYPEAITWNVKWLMMGYGSKIALLAFFGVALSSLAAILYASTVSRQRPDTQFVSALNNQFGEIRQELQSVKRGNAGAPGYAPTITPNAPAAPTYGAPAADPRRSAATVIERPGAGAATIIERPGAGLGELRVVSGASAGRSWKLPMGESKLGRDASNVVVVEDSKASREHAKIRFAEGMYTIADLGSANGTFVNERQVSGQTPLTDGDLIRIGDTTLAFKPANA